jgi:hypothetical protein
MPREFTCIDCGGRVVSYINPWHDNDNDVCMQCEFLRTTMMPSDREALRALLNRPDANDDT